MIYKSLRITLLPTLLLATLSMLNAQSGLMVPIDEPVPPYLVVTPEKPVALESDVAVQVILGTSSNSCFAPNYINCTSRIVESALTIFPPLFTVFVSYNEATVADIMCPEVYNPVKHGPVFKLGRLKAGTYRVVADNTDATISAQRTFGEFTVAAEAEPAGFQISGTVHDDPSPLKRASFPVEKAKMYLYTNPLILEAATTDAERIIAPVRIFDSTITDVKGFYAFRRAPAGSYRIVCTHPEFRTQSKNCSLKSDTTLSFSIVSIEAAAKVAGRVIMGAGSTTEAKPLPLCTLTLSNYNPRISHSDVTPSYLLRAITGNDGSYAFDKVPITMNGETWYIVAQHGSFNEMRTLKLYNMQTETANFMFAPLYENRDSVVSANIACITATDKFSYKSGEPVYVRYTVTNRSKSDAKFGPFGGLCEYDLIITNIDNTTPVEVYRASSHAACLDNIVYLSVPSGTSLVKNFPAWYYSKDSRFAADLPEAEAGELVPVRPMKFKVTARLQDKEYDYTEVGVPIEILPIPVGIAQPAVNSASQTSAVQMHGSTITLTLQNNQDVRFNAYRLNGSKIPGLSSNRYLNAGTSTIALRELFSRSGYAILEIKGSDFTRRFSTVTLPR